jgi:hypothetical protein
VSVGPAIGADQDFVVATLDGATAAVEAIRSHDAHAFTGRSFFALRALGAGRSLRSRLACRAGVTFWSLRTGRPLIA